MKTIGQNFDRSAGPQADRRAIHWFYCQVTRKPRDPVEPHHRTHRRADCRQRLLAGEPAEPGVTLHVSPSGNDANPGTPANPLATIAAAQRAARTFAGRRPVTVLLHEGVYYLPDTIRFTAEDSGTEQAPVLYTSAPGERPVISGGERLELEWAPRRNGIFQAKTQAGLAMDQLFVNGQRQPMARYPNYDPEAQHFNGCGGRRVRPGAGGTLDRSGRRLHPRHAPRTLGRHALPDHRQEGRRHADYEGGWQNNRPAGCTKQFRFVENIFEELDAPGEWFHDRERARSTSSRPPTSI